jgi:hypothetical protein
MMEELNGSTDGECRWIKPPPENSDADTKWRNIVEQDCSEYQQTLSQHTIYVNLQLKVLNHIDNVSTALRLAARLSSTLYNVRCLTLHRTKPKVEKPLSALLQPPSPDQPRFAR